MKYKINYTANSSRDLNEIWDHIASEFQNVSAAERIVNKIMDDVEQLADFPKLGTPLSSITDTKSDYRFLVTEAYLTFYRFLGGEIRIDRILYGRRNYLDILLGDTMEKKTES